jgi:PAS domain S-box-containing protein/putative nucleotidyltransferase with HDIG domain
LETILPEKATFDDYEVEHDFATIGSRTMLLNARQIQRASEKERIILLAIEDITERKRLEESVAESEERYRRVFETANDGIVLLEKREGKITHANPAAEKMLGYSAKECVGNKLWDIGVSLDMGDFQTAMQDLDKIGILHYNDVPVENKSGSHIDTDIYLVDRARLVQCNIRDIAEHKRVLRSNEGRLRTLVQTIPDLIWLKDRDGIYLSCNTMFERFFGVREANMVGKTDYDFVDRELADSFREHDRAAMAAGKPTSKEDWITFADDGHRCLMDAIKAPVYDAQGALIGVLGIGRDITERKQAEEVRDKIILWQQGVNLLQRSLLEPGTLEEKLRTVTDSIVSIFDADFSRIWLIQPGDRCEEGCIHADVDEGLHICRYRNQCLCLLASSGRYTHTDGTIHRRVPFGCYKIGRIASGDDHKFISNNVQNDPGIHNHEWARELGLVSFAGYQLRAPGGKALGVLALFAKHPISSREDSMLDGLSSTVALVIQRGVAEKSLCQTVESLRKAIHTTIQVMVSAVEARDAYTSGHQARVANLARAIATEMGLPQDRIEGLRMAGSIHDIGKLSIPAEILSKPTKLTDIEFSLIKEHVKRGYEMLKDVESPWPLAEIIYQHHEKVNGSGYPNGLTGDNILMESRILSVADVVEAMASHRPYRPALGIDAALGEIGKNRGTFYDEAVVDACLRLFREKGFQLEGN